MTYELAKQLKKAGFPERNSEDCDDRFMCCLHKFNSPLDGRNDEERDCYFPTLSELIEACGDKFQELRKYSANTKDRQWLCRSNESDYFYGETPEEAVAKLWLELRK